MAQCSPPKHAPGTAYQCERRKKKISYNNYKHIGNETWLTM